MRDAFNRPMKEIGWRASMRKTHMPINWQLNRVSNRTLANFG